MPTLERERQNYALASTTRFPIGGSLVRKLFIISVVSFPVWTGEMRPQQGRGGDRPNKSRRAPTYDLNQPNELVVL